MTATAPSEVRDPTEHDAGQFINFLNRQSKWILNATRCNHRMQYFQWQNLWRMSAVVGDVFVIEHHHRIYCKMWYWNWILFIMNRIVVVQFTSSIHVDCLGYSSISFLGIVLRLLILLVLLNNNGHKLIWLCCLPLTLLLTRWITEKRAMEQLDMIGH